MRAKSNDLLRNDAVYLDEMGVIFLVERLNRIISQLYNRDVVLES